MDLICERDELTAELTAAMTLEESLQNGCTFSKKRLLVWVEASSYFSELRSQKIQNVSKA